ncbi:unnamed protein product [Enterobius vermicularis]|uniref:ANK_REP_REGION domain-containing protein n=1 Tax=Enterobius vermicularis TaxID=51028 RepID=A0A0N4VJN9_ENTVE|nr:unnamed protein product [Enterobius vermicularis]
MDYNHVDQLFHQSAEKGDLEILLLFQKEAMLMAAKNGFDKIVEVLVEYGTNYGTDINATDSDAKTLLMLASENGHINLVRFLVEKNADVNTENSNEETPLTLASENGHIDVVRYLLKRGANANAGTSQLVILCAEYCHTFS